MQNEEVLKKKKKIHKDKKGRTYIKESYFVGGKMKFRRIYLINGIPEEEYYLEHATDLEHYINGDYWLMSRETDVDTNCDETTTQKSDFYDGETDELPF